MADDLLVNSTDDSSDYSTYLSLSTARMDDEDQESGEITFTEFNITAASIRVLARVQGAPGAVAGIFTYQNDTQESDIELFTRAPDTFVQYSNQPASTGEPDWTPIPGATTNNTIPRDWTYGEWLVHRLDWVLGQSVFFVNDEQTNATTLHVPVADPPSAVYLDMWSANSSWSGSMQIGEEAAFDIQWVELVFNATEEVGDKRSEGSVCTVGAIDVKAAEKSGASRLVLKSGLLAAGLLAGLVVL